MSSRHLVAFAALLFGCFEYSPHEVPSSRRSLRAENLARLEASAPTGRLRFAVIGDVQRAFDDASAAVRFLNGVDDLAFVVQLGDFTDTGRSYEYELMCEVFGGLRVPWFVVVGNHDLLGNGGTIFDDLFGPRNSAFTHERTHFVVLDTNSREYGFGSGVPDLDWLSEQLTASASYDRVVVLAHVWPWDGDFDPDLRDAFVARLKDAGVALSLHAHGHDFRDEVHESVRYVMADDAASRTLFLVEELPTEELDVQRVAF